MPQQTQPSVLNNFSAGLKTEFTGLNFPENACPDADNCTFDIIGNVTRRAGFNYELNDNAVNIDRASRAISSYKWNNAGGDGLTQLIVVQIGAALYFYQSTNATVASPLSTTKLSTTVDLTAFQAGFTSPAAIECQYSDGNGYLFVYHPSLSPFYCSFASSTVTATAINIQVRDFEGILEMVADQNRPSALSAQHNYNLINQGWVGTTVVNRNWSSGTDTSTHIGGATIVGPSANTTWTVSAGLTAIAGDNIIISGGGGTGNVAYIGTVNSYSGTTIVMNNLTLAAGISQPWIANHIQSQIAVPNADRITPFHTALGVYPSNSDQWWLFKNSSNVFDPATTVNNVTISGPAPKGYELLDAFNQRRTDVSGIAGIANVSTSVRPRTGTFFAGRVWYTGVDASVAAAPDFPFYTWTENIYFSQIIENTSQFGKCYQTNDPTSEDRFDLLPSDGGIIKIQGTGSIYKLFPMQNGLVVFAANGIWIITGSAGIGFTANDYNIAKISAVRSMSSTSFVDVQGVPYWWNEEGIYKLSLGQETGANYGSSRGAASTSGLQVENICLGTILSFYADIPLQSKKFVRGYYNPIDYIIQWVYRSTNESSVTDRYEFNRILNHNTATKAFYPWTMANVQPHIHDVMYVAGPGGSTSPEPVFKYLTSNTTAGTYAFTFSEQRDDTTWKDWFGENYTSFFKSGFRIKGNAQRRTQSNYIYVYSDNSVDTAYKMQGIWDYATNTASGKYTNLEQTTISSSNFGNIFKRHRIRGRGIVNQFRIQSVDGSPFNIIGWSVEDKVNTGV